jgi:hypothetical protein
MSNSGFLSKQNVSMLWDIISDEDLFKFLSRENQNKMLNIFSENLKAFFDAETRNKSSLIDMNKKYIIITLNIIKQNFQKQPNKIKILEEISQNSQKNLITYEEIQNEKKSQFEKDLNKRKEDFTSLLSVSVPPVPEFKDKYDNAPITEMENLIKEITAQRNYDVEQINKTKNITPGHDNWLKTQETSIKKEKFDMVRKNNTNENEIKHNIVNNIKLNITNDIDQKNVTWGNNEIINYETNETNETNNEENIFNKLKKIHISKKTVNERFKDISPDIKQNISLIVERIDKISDEINQLRGFLQNITENS